MTDFSIKKVDVWDGNAPALQQQGAALRSRAEKLRATVLAVYCNSAERRERAQVQKGANDFAEALLKFDAECVAYYKGRLQVPYVNPDIVAVHMQLWASNREILGRYLREVTQLLNDTEMRALTRAILWVSAVVLLVTAATLCVAIIPLR